MNNKIVVLLILSMIVIFWVGIYHEKSSTQPMIEFQTKNLEEFKASDARANYVQRNSSLTLEGCDALIKFVSKVRNSTICSLKDLSDEDKEEIKQNYLNRNFNVKLNENDLILSW